MTFAIYLLSLPTNLYTSFVTDIEVATEESLAETLCSITMRADKITDKAATGMFIGGQSRKTETATTAAAKVSMNHMYH